MPTALTLWGLTYVMASALQDPNSDREGTKAQEAMTACKVGMRFDIYRSVQIDGVVRR